MKIILKILTIFILCASIFYISQAAQTKICIIVNKSVDIELLDKGQILDIYTLNTRHWEDGSKITLIDYNGYNRTKKRYYKYLGISYSKIQKIWLRKQFSGKAKPPITYKTEKEVVDIVASTTGAIGYVSASKVSNDVKIIATID